MTSAWYRVCAHVLVLDERSRILLVSARDPDDDRLVWFALGAASRRESPSRMPLGRELSEIPIRIGP